MGNFTRRDFSVLALLAMWKAVRPDSCWSAGRAAARTSTFGNVQIGIQSYSFRNLSLKDAAAAIASCAVNNCELSHDHVEPRFSGERGEARAALRHWRTTVPLRTFEDIRRQLANTGIAISSYQCGMNDDCTDEEIDRFFQMATALGAQAMTASTTLSASRRVDWIAQKHKMRVGLHNHSIVQPNAITTPDDFAVALKGASPYLMITLDIGHFTAAGFDPLAFLRTNHARMLSLHIKDRRKNQGEAVEFGKGDTPIRDVLRLVNEHSYPIRGNIEYEYAGTDAVSEVRKCLKYCREAIA